MDIKYTYRFPKVNFSTYIRTKVLFYVLLTVEIVHHPTHKWLPVVLVILKIIRLKYKIILDEI